MNFESSKAGVCVGLLYGLVAAGLRDPEDFKDILRPDLQKLFFFNWQ
ncbi:hypothetical protein TcasGA2_TC031225 [Tribolium castaneum]|uniref:Uncharacterized protein n=1 Tax=Tribolium castaneum TaxID=7070 RepID=A0A139WA90_TRICA|nr:hypothetical protein TcasGA2_TC031225 [Tribolium castaneum]